MVPLRLDGDDPTSVAPFIVTAPYCKECCIAEGNAVSEQLLASFTRTFMRTWRRAEAAACAPRDALKCARGRALIRELTRELRVVYSILRATMYPEWPAVDQASDCEVVYRFINKYSRSYYAVEERGDARIPHICFLHNHAPPSFV